MNPSPLRLHVSGMTCGNCARKVTTALQSLPGVHSATADPVTGCATVRWNPDANADLTAVLAALDRAGFPGRELAAEAGSAPPRRARWQWPLLAGLTVTALLMAGEWLAGFSDALWFRWTSFALASLVQFWAGAEFYRGAWRQLQVGASNMDTLVALGSSTAYGYSLWALLDGAGGHLYFMEAAAIISLISAGHWIEARVSDRAGNTLRGLMTLAPATARKLLPASPPPAPPRSGPFSFNLRAGLSAPPAVAESKETEVPVASLKPGDHVVLKPGDRVPVDGRVLSGESAVDEAMLTGESQPVDKRPGTELFAGTVNLNGRLVFRVEAIGQETALAHIIAAVQRAQTSRADIQRLGDRVSNVFVPIITLIALGAALWWGLAPASARALHDALMPYLWHAPLPPDAALGFIIAAAVLIVACPCAMGLATPAALMAAANTAARRGLLIRDGIALEKAGNITAILFDKTGTLTAGKPVVAAAFVVPGAAALLPSDFPAPKVLASALARRSNHPLSQAVASLAADEISLAQWREVRGSGVEALAGAVPVKLGSLTWLAESPVDLTVGETFVAEWAGQGASLVGLVAGEKLLAVFALRDPLKPGADRVVRDLQAHGLKVYLVTGDHARTAAGIARQAGIAPENVFAGVRPERKAELVKELQARGQRVAFVGDGINDAPALTQADLGVAVSRASDIAREAADLILLKSEIAAVPEALGLARATLRIIKQNLFWAFFYNALAVPLAALGFISPVVCAAAMGFSDLIVIGNALRLLRWKKRK